MAPPPTALRDTTRAQDAAATPYARALVRWAQAFGRREIARAAQDPAGYLRTTKARGDVSELVRLLRLFGVRWGADVSPALLGLTVPGVPGAWGPSPGAQEEGRQVVWVDLDQLTSILAQDPDTYVGPGGRAAIGDRIARALAFLRAGGEGETIDMPELVVRAGGALSVRDGRHRLEALRQLGVTRVPVTADAEDVEEIGRRVGATPPPLAPASRRAVDDAVAGKSVRVTVFQQWIEGRLEIARSIAAGIQDRIRESVRTIVAESRADRATVGEVTRRIATQVHAVEPEDGPEKGRVYAFSFARAETIARTELSQVENTARAAEFEATGEPGDEYEWLAYTDGRSGDRHHERMHRVRIPAGGRFSTPLGHSVRYPGDPLAPIEETANCRCTWRRVPGRRARAAR
jgi:hypothetical protein